MEQSIQLLDYLYTSLADGFAEDAIDTEDKQCPEFKD